MDDRPVANADEDLLGRSMVPSARGLSTKLLVLTAIFVLLAEILIFIPSIANFRLRWLEERLNTAAAVGTVLEQQNPSTLSRSTQMEVLAATGVKAIAVRDGLSSRLLVSFEETPRVDERIAIGATGPMEAIRGALDSALFGGSRYLLVSGAVGDSEREFEIVIPDKKLRAAMLVYSRNIAILSLIISLITAMLVFYAINWMMIRPIRDMTRSMLRFSQAPDDPLRIIQPEPRGDEIGVAERELAGMQKRLHTMLNEQRHLADLGLAVSKINHDMRNILASAQLMSDRLRMIKDPTVQAFAPKLLHTLDRAIAYTEGVLAYGRTQEAPPQRRRLQLRQLIDDVYGLLGVDPASGIELENQVDALLEVDADSDQLFRVLTNLCRNAVEAMAGAADGPVRRLSISCERVGSVCRIHVLDTGPGLPQKARENLFAAFRGSARSGGTGLGLAIAHELIRAHGGSLELLESGSGRTVFCITIPDLPVNIEEARSSLRRTAQTA